MSQAGSASEPVEGGEDAVEQLADRLAAEERPVVRDDAAKRVDERVLELRGRDRREPVAAELLQLRPDLRRAVRGDELRRLHRPRQPARDHAVERDPREQLARRLGLRSALVGQRNRLGRHGTARVVEVGHRAVAHEVDPAAGRLGHR